jgi:head-tail adaptor
MKGAGSLRTLVTFQQRTQAADGYGGHTETWGGDTKVPCHFVSGSGREVLTSGRLEADVTATLRARSKAVTSIDESWRAVINGTAWNITSKFEFSDRGQWADFTLTRAGKDRAA